METMDEEAERLREERRVKMKEIKNNMGESDDFWRESVTSAPNVRNVEEFHEDLSAADKRKRTAEKLLQKNPMGPKEKLQLEERRHEKRSLKSDEFSSSLDENNLVAKALQRRNGPKKPKQLEDDIAAILDDEDDDSFSISSTQSRHAAKSADITDVARQRKMSLQSNPSYSNNYQNKSISNKKDDNAIKMVNGTDVFLGQAQVLEQQTRECAQQASKDNYPMNISGKKKSQEIETRRPSSHTTKVYDDGRYVAVDQGYLSASNGSSPTEKNVAKKVSTKHIEDPLSQSLPVSRLKKLKTEKESVHQQLMNNIEPPQEKVKVVYDARMFLKDKGTPNADPEESYYAQMSSGIVDEARKETKPSEKKLSKGDSFKDFLNNTFTKSNISQSQTGSLATLSAVKLEQDQPRKMPDNNGKSSSEDAVIDCIDLGNGDNDTLYDSYTTSRSMSPTFSMRTNSEFGDPDSRGRSKHNRSSGRSGNLGGRARDMLNSSMGGIMLFIQGIGSGRGNVQSMAHPPSEQEWRNASRQSNLSGTVNSYEDDQCGHCGRSGSKKSKRGMSCCTIIFLLAVDAFTIGLLLMLYSHVDSFPIKDYPEIYGMKGKEHSGNGPYHDQQIGVSHSGGSGMGTIQGRSLSDPSFGSKTSDGNTSTSTTTTTTTTTLSPDIQQTNTNITSMIEHLQEQIDVLKRPPAFACHKNSPHLIQGKIKYDQCNVVTEGIDPGEGTFTVKVPGIYHLSFTGLFHALDGHEVSANLVKREQGSNKLVSLGRSAAVVKEKGFDDNLTTSTTIALMVMLDRGIEISVHMKVVGHGASHILSTPFGPTIHFTGHRVSDP